jgi:uncharacterized protein (TIGR02145 family)
MYKLFLITVSVLFLSSARQQSDNTFKDPRDGTVYKTVKIGNQIWMCENLKYKTTGAVAYNNDKANVAAFGYLYDWATAEKVCPKGWHLPKEADWKTLLDFLGGKNTAGGKLKAKDGAGWKAPNTAASNASGFSAGPGGAFIGGVFQYKDEAAYYWSSEAECTSSYVLYLTHKAGFADRKIVTKTDKVSIRCIKD